MRNDIDHETRHPGTAPEVGKDSGHWLSEVPAVDGVALPPKVGDSWKSLRRLGD